MSTGSRIRGVAIRTLHFLAESILFQNAARCIISPNCPVPFTKVASRYIGEWMILPTAGAGKKLTETFPFGPKPTKCIRKGTTTERKLALRLDFGGKPSIV